jgi:hypothetical protein
LPPNEADNRHKSEILDISNNLPLQMNFHSFTCSEDLIGAKNENENKIDKIGDNFKQKMKNFYQISNNLAR